MSSHISNVRPDPDKVLVDIADYVCNYEITSNEAYETARYCLIDTLGCGLEALDYPACTKLLGPVVPGTIVPDGARVRALGFSSILFRPPSTSARWSAGSTSTTHGLPRNGAIHQTISAVSLQPLTGSPVPV